MRHFRPIEAHGVVGDGRSVALIADDGTVDFLCWPRFDSAASFAALLDDGEERAGAWSLRPEVPFHSTQSYVDDTNLLRTAFHGADGSALSVIDFMPAHRGPLPCGALSPSHQLVRIARATRGEVTLSMRLRLSPGFGREKLRLEDRGRQGFCFQTRRGAFHLQAELPLYREGDVLVGRRTLREGERCRFSLSWSKDGPSVLSPLGATLDEAEVETARFWRRFVARVRYGGPHGAAVRRSALLLKLLQYPPSGALLAAPTTSLPEREGGALNWDYRFCWLRDAAFMVRSFLGLGLREEAEAFVYWMLHTTQLTLPALDVLYDVYGNPPKPERTVEGLKGYRRSVPVRVGNAAQDQLQLDMHGEVIDAICAFVEAGGELDRGSRRMLIDLGGYVAKSWILEDASLWEDRGPRRHHTHSKVLCWAALDGLIRLEAKGLLPALSPRIRAARQDLGRAIRAHAVDEARGTYVDTFGGHEVDAALLLIPWYGFEPASSPLMKKTFARIVSELGELSVLLHRNLALRAQGDAPFVACSYWAVEFLADGGGTLEEAERWFDALAHLATPLGLFAEEVDPRSGRALGNFPQAFSHVGQVSAALAIEERRSRDRKRIPSLRSALEVSS